MRSFFISFLAALLAIAVSVLVGIFILFSLIANLLNNSSSGREDTGKKAVLVLDLGQAIHEQMVGNPLSELGADNQYDHPGVYDVIRLIHSARKDSSIKGIYLACNENQNGFATNEEIRNALLDFKQSGKFVYAYGDVIPQKAYYVGNVADKIYCNPKGGVDWRGFAIEIPFLKETLKMLEIEPQIFYAGKFKSATEPLREEKMTDANRLQTGELLSGLYNHFLYQTALARGLDTNLLRKCVNEHLVKYAEDALSYKLVDGLKYDDEVKDEIRSKLRIGLNEKINFISIGTYAKAVNYRRVGKDRIALIYAEGDIISGKGDHLEIGGDTYRSLIRQARMDKDIKAIVLRINSGGGSSLVSENLWRELTITRKEKPVIVSFGDVAASGAYYISCNADSIFAEPTTITGSIGVFGLLPNMQRFFKDKLGVTFDGVKTGPDADELTVTKPLTEMQKRYLQNEVDSIYQTFKFRVAEGRKKSVEYVDSIAQGRVWVGEKAVKLGLVDQLGSLQDAVDCAARMARTEDYRLKEYPEPKSLLELILGTYKKSVSLKAVKDELGEEGYRTYTTIKRLKAMAGVVQARIPVDFKIE
ncbi:MAG TPA: signal peptide peptidase SppA [Puia sp.]|nr:signal peptide peptidase SppA [Puia sp.]